MPTKRAIQLRPPVLASEEEEDQGFASDHGSESKPELEELDGSEESESESGSHGKMKKNPSDDEESESEAGSHNPDPTVKPPMEHPAKKITPVKSGAGLKRRAEKEPTRAKKKLVVPEEIGAKKGEDQKKPFQRLWSEDDEVVILEGIRDFVAQKGIDLLNNMNTFHHFIKKSLGVAASTIQLKNKVHKLKKKFLNNCSEEGKDRIFSTPHEQKLYDVSKKIWASDGKLVGLDSSEVNNASARKNSAQRVGKSGAGEQSGARKNVEFGRSVGIGIAPLEHEILKDGLEEKWKTLRVEEYQLYLKKVELMKEMITLVLEANKAEKED